MCDPLQPDEETLTGKFNVKDGVVVADEITKRIAYLIEHGLEKVADSTDGWSQLFVNPQDGRHFELSYPDHDQHGGGPPRLSFVSPEELTAKWQRPPQKTVDQ